MLVLGGHRQSLACSCADLPSPMYLISCLDTQTTLSGPGYVGHLWWSTNCGPTLPFNSDGAFVDALPSLHRERVRTCVSYFLLVIPRFARSIGCATRCLRKSAT